MPVTSAPRPAIASARMPPPQPTSSTRLPPRLARSSIQSRRSGLMSCSGRNSPCGSHQRWASWLNFSSSAGSTFIQSIVPKKSPAEAGLACGSERLLVGRTRLAGRRAARTAGARARPGGRTRGRRRAGRGGGLAAAEQLGLHAAVRLQAGDELGVLVVRRAHLVAVVAGDRLALAFALDLQAA